MSVPPGPQPAGDLSVPPGPQPAGKPKSRFVFGFMPALTFGLNVIPSLDLPFFFGRRLRYSPWALGFQFTLSVGGAERYSLGLATHRYHFTALTRFGAEGRGFASVGGGLAVRSYSPLVEAEGRLGVRFGQRGILAAVFRLGYDYSHREGAPVPQLGIVVGLSGF